MTKLLQKITVFNFDIKTKTLLILIKTIHKDIFMSNKKRLSKKVAQLATPLLSPYDINGAYTGTPTNGEVITGTPTQDADDL